MLRIRALVIPVLAAALLTACGGRTKTATIIAGSTSVQPYAEILAEEYERRHPHSAIDIQGGGSAAGITAAESGTADIGMSSRSLKEAERGMWSAEIAKDGLAVIVHPRNPVGALTLDQIRDIYTAKIGNWQALGGNPAAIHVIAREEGSGTRSAFEDLVMDKQTVSPRAIVQGSNGTVRLLVSEDPNAIGFISLGLVEQEGQKAVKALRLDGVEATRENVINGSYSLFRPFLFIAKGAPDGEAKRFIDFVLSDEGQRILTVEGLIEGQSE
ncbi:phosphate-binding protein [Clostridia bacterium]|nr:phosphate-binding protein [Clostridia bacterium]